MRDNAAMMAQFLIEHVYDISEDNVLGLIADIFPELTHEQLLRGFAIASEVLVSDIQEAKQDRKSPARIMMLQAHQAMLKDNRPR